MKLLICVCKNDLLLLLQQFSCSQIQVPCLLDHVFLADERNRKEWMTWKGCKMKEQSKTIRDIRQRGVISRKGECRT